MSEIDESSDDDSIERPLLKSYLLMGHVILIKPQQRDGRASKRHYQDVMLFQLNMMYALTAKALSDGSGQVSKGEGRLDRNYG